MVRKGGGIDELCKGVGWKRQGVFDRTANGWTEKARDKTNIAMENADIAMEKT